MNNKTLIIFKIIILWATFSNQTLAQNNISSKCFSDNSCSDFKKIKVEKNSSDVYKDMSNESSRALSIYRKNGMFGLVSKSDDCYNNIKINKYRCLYFDIASIRIEQISGGGSKFPQTEYFTEEQFLSRAIVIFIKSGFTMELANEYLLNAKNIIDRMVDEAIIKSMK